MKGNRTLPFSKLNKIIQLSDYSWESIEKNLITIKAGIRNGEIKPNFPIKINYKLGSIIGHILGDGSIEKRFHSLFYSNSNLLLLKEFNNYMKEIFGIEARKWVQKKRSFNEKSEWLMKVDNLNKVPEKHSVGLFYPKICTDILYSICGKFAEGTNKTITKEIMNASKDFKKGLIRAFFDDESSVRAESYTVRLYQDRKDILEDLKEMIRKFNVESNLTKGYDKRGKQRYYFNITGFRNYYHFYHNIGCTSPKKKREFEILINKVKNSKQFKKKYSL